jgi:hypothetical protein
LRIRHSRTVLVLADPLQLWHSYAVPDVWVNGGPLRFGRGLWTGVS